MILRSIRIQGWRCFVDPVEVGPFSEGLNVLHAPNATGKSTLFEAVLRALLDSHRVSGRDIDLLQPWGRALSPTVTVGFSNGGIEYQLTKRFLDHPSAELTRKEGERYVRIAEGDSADERVREILTRNPPGRGLARRDNWGLAQVLWAPQGNLALTDLSGDVVADIRTALGAQVAGSGGGQLEEYIENAYDKFFTQGGKLRAGKDAPPLISMRSALKAAEEERRQALALYQEYEDASRHVEDLRACKLQARRDADELANTLSQARERMELYKALEADLNQQKERAVSAEAEHSALKQCLDSIAAAEGELAETRSVLNGLREQMPALARDVIELEKAALTADSALEEARIGRQVVDLADERAQLAERYKRALQDIGVLDQRAKQISEAMRALTRREKERAEVVAPEEKTLRAIRKAITDRDEAQVRLDAALISLEIVLKDKGKLLVVSGEKAGPRAVAAGVPLAIKGSPEVVVDLPGIARIRASGPAQGVDDFRADRDRATQRLNSLTAGYGTSDLEALEALREKAQLLDKGVADAATRVETLLAGGTQVALEQELRRLNVIRADIEKRYPDWRDVPPDAGTLSAEAREIRRAFIEQVTQAEKAWKGAHDAIADALKRRTRLSDRIEGEERRQARLASRLSTLSADGRLPAEREADLRRLVLRWDAAHAKLEDAQKALQNLGPDPAPEVKRLGRQLQAADETASRALEKESREEGRLDHLSAQGPYSALARTEEDVARLQQDLSMEEMRVLAIKLLRDTVSQCRAEALAAVAAPVEIAASRILQRVAGSRLGRIRLENTFEPGRVSPDMAEETVSVEHISGGEREQVYLATRLALAEVLAQGERQLVVLDDVLTATDAGRLARVMDILEEAAQRLQLLILTCHPERYRGLEGACFIDLEAAIRGA